MPTTRAAIPPPALPHRRSGRGRSLRSRPPGTALLGLLGLLLMGLAFGSPAALGQEGTVTWLQLQGGPAHQGSVPVGSAPAPGLAAAYQAGPAGDAGVAGVVVARPDLALAVGTERVFAFDPSTGRPAPWEDVSRASGQQTVPAVDPAAGDHGVAVFTEGNGPGNSRLVVSDLSSGARMWTVPLGEVVTGSPAIAEGLAIVGALDRRVYLVDLETQVVKKMGVPGQVGGTPAVAGTVAYVTSEEPSSGKSWLTAIDVADRAAPKIRWSYRAPTVAVGTSSPTITGDLITVGFSDRVVRAFRAAEARPVWQQPVRGDFSEIVTLASAEGDVFVLDHLGGVYRLDGETGRQRWDFQFPEVVLLSSPFVAGSFVYVGMDDGTVAAIDTDVGRLRWKATFTFGPMGAFAPAGDLLLASATGRAGGVIALRHDPAVHLLDEPSPTSLRWPIALANYVAAALVLGAILLLLFRLVLRRATRRRPPHAEESSHGAAGWPEGDGAEPEEGS